MQTPEQLKQYVESNLEEINKTILLKLDRMIRSGCVNLESYSNNYELSNIFIASALKVMADEYKPRYRNQIKEMNNISLFI